MTPYFICPECGDTKLEEIQVGVTIATEINCFHFNNGQLDEIVYGEQTNEDGHIDRYRR